MDKQLVTSYLEKLSFTAIDFETANEKRASICSFGYAKVRNGKIVETNNILIKPRELRFTTINTSIHGISAEAVKSVKEFCDLWPSIEYMFKDELLVAHNASFDVESLRQTLDLYGLPHPNFKYICTYKLAQEAFRDLENYRLSDVAEYLGVDFEHHNSQADALVSAIIAITAIPKLSQDRFAHDQDELTYYLNKKASAEKVKSLNNLFQEKKIDSYLLKPNLDVADKSNLFYNQKVVFTGDLKAFNRSEAAKRLQALGADVNTAISAKTNIVVMGSNAGPSKLAKVESLIAKGKDIRVIHEEEFVDLVNVRYNSELPI